MAATNGADTPVADGDINMKPPADVVIPPKAVRETITKTAEFVYRKGLEMENNIRNRSAGSDPKFGFLNLDDPYYTYYAWYLEQLREGKAPNATGAQGTQTARDNKPKGPEKPPEFHFSARMPNMSAKDLEILKVTASYTARNGENWLKDLRSRETNNPQFDFLRATHSFFQYFRALVDQYKSLLEEEKTIDARIEEIQHSIKTQFNILKRAKHRAEYSKYTSQQKEKEEKRVQDEKKEYLSVDWQDFAIIATVTFEDLDDTENLPPPTTLNDLQSASLEQKAAISLSARRIEEAAPDEETYYNVSQQQPNFAPPPPMPYQPLPPPPPQVAGPVHVDYRSPVERARDDEEERANRERQAERDRAARAQAAAKAPGSMRIRTDYVPRAAAKRGNVHLSLCPNCNQQFPADELEEHIRIELLDPRWKEMREKSDSRYSSVLNTVDVASNLKRFASQRDDIYDGVTGVPISEEEAARRKKAALSYDGQPDPAKDAARLQQMQSMNVQDQLRRIQERHGGK